MDAAQKQRALHAVSLFAAGSIIVFALWPSQNSNAVAGVLTTAFGFGAWMLPLWVWDHALSLLQKRIRVWRVIKWFFSMSLLCTALHLVSDAGGRLGAILGGSLLAGLGLGAYVVCAAVLLVAVSRWTPLTPVQSLGAFAWSSQRRLAAAWHAGTARDLELHTRTRAVLTAASGARTPLAAGAGVTRVVASTIADAEVIGVELVDEGDAGLELDDPTTKPATPPPLPVARRAVTATRLAEPPPPIETVAPKPSTEPAALVQPAPEVASRPDAPYRLPSSTLLAAPPPGAREADERVLKATALQLEEKLAGFGILGRVDGLTPGPVVTMYEFEPAAGTKLSKIRALAAELSMAVGMGVRIIAPLPGTARVGIEVPHAEADREVVYLRELVEDQRWTTFAATLPIALGKDAAGQPVYCDLARMPHLLVAGKTGAGKSVGLNVMLASLLMRKSPDECRLLLIDPKVVELAAFADIPHLLVPVVTELQDAITALRWAVGEMERRYRLLAQAGVKNLETFNARADIERLPSIVVLIDEFGDLMLADKDKRVEAALERLAQKARAAGIHLVLATQYPTVDVITGLIKANLARIAFRVATSTESQVVLGPGVTGAKNLIGRGDMLAQLPGSLDLQRVHSAFVTDDELKALCDCMREQRAPEYDDAVLAAPEASADDDAGDAADDPFYVRAVELVAAARSCSVSWLQRQLNVGYNRAAKIVERMEREGVVGPAARGGGKREVLIAAP